MIPIDKASPLNLDDEREDIAWLRSEVARSEPEISIEAVTGFLDSFSQALDELETARRQRQEFAQLAAYWKEQAQTYSGELEQQFRQDVTAEVRRAASPHPLYPERAEPYRHEEDVA